MLGLHRRGGSGSTEDEAWVHEVAQGCPGYLKSFSLYSVCLQLSQTGYEIQHGAGRECKDAQVHRVYQKGAEEAQSVWKVAEGCRSRMEVLEVVEILWEGN